MIRKDRRINRYLYIKRVVCYDDVEYVASLVSATGDVLFEISSSDDVVKVNRCRQRWVVKVYVDVTDDHDRR